MHQYLTLNQDINLLGKQLIKNLGCVYVRLTIDHGALGFSSDPSDIDDSLPQVSVRMKQRQKISSRPHYIYIHIT